MESGIVVFKNSNVGSHSEPREEKNSSSSSWSSVYCMVLPSSNSREEEWFFSILPGVVPLHLMARLPTPSLSLWGSPKRISQKNSSIPWGSRQGLISEPFVRAMSKTHHVELLHQFRILFLPFFFGNTYKIKFMVRYPYNTMAKKEVKRSLGLSIFILIPNVERRVSFSNPFEQVSNYVECSLVFVQTAYPFVHTLLLSLHSMYIKACHC